MSESHDRSLQIESFAPPEPSVIRALAVGMMRFRRLFTTIWDVWTDREIFFRRNSLRSLNTTLIQALLVLSLSYAAASLLCDSLVERSRLNITAVLHQAIGRFSALSEFYQYKGIMNDDADKAEQSAARSSFKDYARQMAKAASDYDDNDSKLQRNLFASERLSAITFPLFLSFSGYLFAVLCRTRAIPSRGDVSRVFQYVLLGPMLFFSMVIVVCFTTLRRIDIVHYIDVPVGNMLDELGSFADRGNPIGVNEEISKVLQNIGHELSYLDEWTTFIKHIFYASTMAAAIFLLLSTVRLRYVTKRPFILVAIATLFGLATTEVLSVVAFDLIQWGIGTSYDPPRLFPEVADLLLP